MSSGVKIKGLDRLVRKLKEWPEEIAKDVDEELSIGAIQVAGLANELAPTGVTGQLGQRNVADTTTFLEKNVTNNLFYAPFVEFGTGKKVNIPAGLEDVAAKFKGPTNRGNFEQMVDSILYWAKKKGYIKGRNQRAQARFMSMKILKNGIRPRPFFFRALDALEPDIIKNVKRAIKWHK